MRERNQDETCVSWEGAVKEEIFPYTEENQVRFSIHLEVPSLAGVNCGGVEGKAERDIHRGLVFISTHQPETLARSPAGAGRGWMLRLRLLRSDPMERTGLGCVKTARGDQGLYTTAEESGKKPRPARETRDHCWGVSEKRGSLP